MFPTKKCSTTTLQDVLIPAAPMIVKWSVFLEEGTALLPSCRSRPTESASVSSPNLCAIGWIAMFHSAKVPHSRMLLEARMDPNIALSRRPLNMRRMQVKSVASASLWSIALQNTKRKIGMSTREFVSKHSSACYLFTIYVSSALPTVTSLDTSPLYSTVTILYINLYARIPTVLIVTGKISMYLYL